MQKASENKSVSPIAAELMKRGGPYTPSEYRQLADAVTAGVLDPADFLRARFRLISPSVDPVEAEIRRRIEERYGAQRAAAERELAEAVAAREEAVAAFFAAHDELRRLETTTWVVSSRGSVEVGAGSPEQIAAARAQLAAAERRWRQASQREQDARAALTELGQQINAYWRQLAAMAP
jgi:hypothetical protein